MMTVLHTAYSAYQRLICQLVAGVFTAVLIPLSWRLHGPQGVAEQLRFLQDLPGGTLGRAVADCLQAHALELIPGYEDHDLKHVLLGYAMTPEDELKLKAFALGNGDYTPLTLALVGTGLLLPALWPELRAHYRRGRRVPPGVYRWRLRDYATRDLAALRREIGLAA
ncbi:hypothetical protein LJ737_08100 [Hymenobacter sp. 15J16-1T3B]|uniref:hypothetical protein n=1 Tax=Hymenobacter sp. 15J16-1T3B TaxID=2886941 RepID=UPI001D11E553|nr:hypothetical protein [Hymenobacter sp. 15J16-1T3B]MCC3157196.1 hypothetical protein [Hymenobacter sp. 15J16-1T3B]